MPHLKIHLSLALFFILAFSCESKPAVAPTQKVVQNDTKAQSETGKSETEEESNENNNSQSPKDTASSQDNTDSEKGGETKKEEEKQVDESSTLRGQGLIKMRRFATNPPEELTEGTTIQPYTNDVPASLVASTETVKNLSLLNYHTPIQDQDGDGPCGAYAMTAAAETFMQKQYINEHIKTDANNFWTEYQSRLSTELVYAAEKDFYFKNLSEDEESFTHKAKLKSTEYLFKTSQVMDAIDAGHPIVMATLVNDTWGRAAANNGFLECRDDANSGGGHYVTILGYALNSKWEGGGVWVIKNSWGEGFADKGYGYLPFGCCENVMCLFIEIEEFEFKD